MIIINIINILKKTSLGIKKRNLLCTKIMMGNSFVRSLNDVFWMWHEWHKWHYNGKSFAAMRAFWRVDINNERHPILMSKILPQGLIMVFLAQTKRDKHLVLKLLS